MSATIKTIYKDGSYKEYNFSGTPEFCLYIFNLDQLLISISNSISTVELWLNGELVQSAAI